jgi:hypothetical protein
MIENNAPPARRGRGWYIAALVAVLVGAFGVQASSTWILADSHHVETYARPFLVLMLEVGSITGAALYLSTRDKVTRRSAGLLVLISSGVGLVGGVTRYGVLLGVASGAVLLLLVHTIGRFWHEPAPVREEPPMAWDDPKPSWQDVAPRLPDMYPPSRAAEAGRDEPDTTCKSCGRGIDEHEGHPPRCPETPTAWAPEFDEIIPPPWAPEFDEINQHPVTFAPDLTPVPRPEPLPAPGPEPEVERPQTRDEPAHADPRPPEPEDREEATRAPEPTLRPVPRIRTRAELEEAGRALPEDLRVIRRAGETKGSLQARVEDAEEKARRRARTSA